MSSPPDTRLTAVLQSDAAAVWQAQLAAAFHDDDAKRRCIEVIRADVAAQAAGLGPAEVAELQNAVVRHLATAVKQLHPGPDRPTTPTGPALAGA